MRFASLRKEYSTAQEAAQKAREAGASEEEMDRLRKAFQRIRPVMEPKLRELFASEILPTLLKGEWEVSENDLYSGSSNPMQSLPNLRTGHYDHTTCFCQKGVTRKTFSYGNTVAVTQPYIDTLTLSNVYFDLINLSKIEADWYYVGSATGFLIAHKSLILNPA
jgi:hypothetical protein